MRTIVLLFAVTLAHAAPPAPWSWLAGDWRRCQDGEIVEERWLGPRGEMMIGANLTSSPAHTPRPRPTCRGSPATGDVARTARSSRSAGSGRAPT